VNDLVVVSFVVTPSSLTVNSVNDAHGHGLSLVTSKIQGSSTTTLQAFMYAELITIAGSSPITITLSGTPTDAIVTCTEWSGVLSAVPVLTSTNLGTSTSATMNIASTSVTPTTNDLVYAYTGYSNCGSTSAASSSSPYTGGIASITSGSPTLNSCGGGNNYRLNDGDQYDTSWAGGSTTAPFTVSQSSPSTGSSGWVELVVDFDPPTSAGSNIAMPASGSPFVTTGIQNQLTALVTLLAAPGIMANQGFRTAPKFESLSLSSLLKRGRLL